MPMNPSPAMSGSLDPYEIAYLRGGRNEVARVVIVSLVERRLLELQEADRGSLRSFVKGSKFIGQNPTRPFINLSDLERTVYDWFAEPRPVADVFRKSLPAELTPYCLPFEERLQRRQLLNIEDGIPLPLVVIGVVAIAVAAVALIVAALRNGLPVGVIITLAVGGIVALIYFGARRRLTADGRAYLSQLRDQAAVTQGPMPYAFAAAVAGTTALAGTPLADLGGEFKKSQQQAASSGCAVWTGSGCGGCGGGGGCGASSGCGGGGGGGCGGGS